MEFKLETYDPARTDLPGFLRRQPEFFREVSDQFHLTTNSLTPTVTVQLDENHIFVTLHIGGRETYAMLGIIIGHLLTWNESVVVSEL